MTAPTVEGPTVAGVAAAATATAPTVAAVAAAARLERLAARLLRRLRPERVDGLTPSQTSMLDTVREFGPLSLREVADREAVTAPTASRAVEVLVQRGLLRTGIDPADGRRHVIELAGDAEARLDERLGGAVEVLARAVDSLPAAHRNALDDALPALDLLVAGLSHRRPA